MGLLYESESYAILGACFEDYKEKGCGFLEAVYHECLKIEFDIQGVPYQDKCRLSLSYKGRPLELSYEPDFLCYEKVIVEIKAVTELNNAFRAQLQNDLKSTRTRLGMLVNFGHHPNLEYERIIL